MVGEKKPIYRGFFRYNGPCGCQDGHRAVHKSVIYIYSIYILLPPLPVPNRPKMELFVVGTSLQVRVTSGLPFGLTDTMGAVDSGAITPLLRTSGSACCPWAQVSHYVEGPTRSNERRHVTRCYIAKLVQGCPE